MSRPAIAAFLHSIGEPAAAEDQASLCLVERVVGALETPTVEMIGAFWRQKNTGSQEPGEVGSDTHDYAAWRAAFAARFPEEGLRWTA